MLGRLLRTLAPLLSIFSLAALTPACTAATDEANSSDDELREKGTMQLVVTVDWEGRDLREDNLLAMENLHARFPQLKIVHFLNAGYYVKLGANRADVTARINRAIRPGDEKALHIHGWKRLFEAAGVVFRGAPTFWGTSIDPNGRECLEDCGHEVPISLYTSAELRKVVKLSLDTLQESGFGRATSFRCGGWMAEQNVRDAIAAEGLTFEHSAVPPTFLAPKLAGKPIHTSLARLWQGTTSLSQPYVLKTSTTPLVEVPDNGALADYVSTAQMLEVFEANKAAFLRDRSKNVVVSFGFHEETAATYLPQLEAALARMFDDAKKTALPLVSATSADLTKPLK